MAEPATIGDNQPPAAVDPLLDRLHEKHADLMSRRTELLGGAERAPTEIMDEATAGKMADFVQKRIDPFLKRAKTTHTGEKEPFLSAGRTVDGFWHFLVDDLEDAKKKLNAVRKAYADKKAAEERRRLDEEARKAREEEESAKKAAEAQAAEVKEEADLPGAIKAEEEAEVARLAAEKAVKEAAAKPAVLGRTRGEHGGMTTLKQFWNFSDLKRAEIDLEALRDHLPADALEKAVKSWINANKEALAGGKRLDGIHIFEDTRL